MSLARLSVGLHLPENERVVRWNEIADICRLAEDVGFDSLWVPDHLIYRDAEGVASGPWECWSQLAAVAAITQRVTIAPLVLCTSFREPGLIAKMATTLDEISGGRLILGLGSGWNEIEYDAFGFPFASRFRRFKEAFTIISTLLLDGEIDFVGDYFTLRQCELRPTGPRPNRIPLLIGSRGENVLRHTLPVVTYWNGWPRWWGNDVSRLPDILNEVDALIEEVGRIPVDITKTAAVFVGLDGGIVPDSPEAPAFRGSAEQIAENLLEYQRAGIDHLQIVLDPITTSGIGQFARVLERIRDA